MASRCMTAVMLVTAPPMATSASGAARPSMRDKSADIAAIASRNRSGGLGTNREHFEQAIAMDGIAPEIVDVCFDPQTSGGLLVAVDAGHMEAIASELSAAGVPTSIVGEVLPVEGVSVIIR